MIISASALDYKLLTTEDDNNITVNTFQNLFNKEVRSWQFNKVNITFKIIVEMHSHGIYRLIIGILDRTSTY